jgi:ABC-2 type transport system ATP-binding protein
MSAPILEVVDLHQRYGATVALERVSFTVAEGEMFGLLGPNGAGKTTLLSILSCLLRATDGTARILGHDVQLGSNALRRLIGIVPQDLAVYGELTARENLEFFGELYGVRGPTLWQRTGEVLDAIGLTDRADRRVETFSGGMKRRLNLGVALMHRPRLLMLDEPTTGVDPQSRNHIFEGVRRLNAEGTTIVYTSHYMEEVQALCRRIGIMDHGRLIACDTLPGLLRQLSGLIRFRVPEVTLVLRDRIKGLPDVRLLQDDGQAVELECPDVKQTLVRLVAVLNEQQVELVSLETEEPNLERVFLHLTGHALRD